MRETIYFGIRLQGEVRVYKRTVVCGGRSELIIPLSPEATYDWPEHLYDWGAYDSGARRLSFELLFDHLDDKKLAKELCPLFARAVVARIERDLSWTLPATRLAEIAAALAADQFCECLGREHLAEVVDFNAYKLRSAK